MSDVTVGVAAENLPYATPEELRSVAEIAEQLNDLHESLETAGSSLYIDDVVLYDEQSGKFAVLVWRTESDSYGVRLGG